MSEDISGNGKRPCVMVFAGCDPSGGAGVQADIEAIGTLGAHALTIITALTVQDNDRVYSVHPVPASLVQEQARALIKKFDISAVKIGIVGNRANAEAIAGLIDEIREKNRTLPVVLDPVFASGHGDPLAVDSAIDTLAPMMAVATLITPNLPETVALCGGDRRLDSQVQMLLCAAPHVLIKGGHGDGDKVTNRWFSEGASRSWTWPRLPGAFHGTGCTLASAIAALLAQGQGMADAIDLAQSYCHETLESAYAIANGQKIPNRTISLMEEKA
jgi:hydroxymethylpyrimidine/phosphomethylpyrimidine kinase